MLIVVRSEYFVTDQLTSVSLGCLNETVVVIKSKCIFPWNVRLQHVGGLVDALRDHSLIALELHIGCE